MYKNGNEIIHVAELINVFEKDLINGILKSTSKCGKCFAA